MKRILSLLILAALCLQLSACRLPPLPSTGSTETTTGGSGTLTTPDFIPADAAAAFLSAPGIVDTSKREYSHDEMMEDLSALREQYPAQLTVEVLGSSLDGREIPVAIIGNKNAKKQVLVSAGIHGREYLTPLLCMKQLEFYLAHYQTGTYLGTSYATLFDACAFYIVPMSNPDGIMLSQIGLGAIRSSSLRAKIQEIYQNDYNEEYTGQTTIDAYLQYWKANAAGTDLNRNFDALWEDYKKGPDRPCCLQYKGPSPESEPETKILSALTRRLDNIQAVLCIHSQGEVLYWNCGQSAELSADTLAFTQAIASRNGYEIKSEQNNDASFSDWCALEQGLIAVTVETGRGFCPLDLDKFLPMWQDNFDLLPLTAYYFLEK